MGGKTVGAMGDKKLGRAAGPLAPVSRVYDGW
jgi:hypothetical protein